MEISVPADFLSVALQAMVNLKKNGKSNVLYRLARGLSTMRKDGAGSKSPINRMLLEYISILRPHHRYIFQYYIMAIY